MQQSSVQDTFNFLNLKFPNAEKEMKKWERKNNNNKFPFTFRRRNGRNLFRSMQKNDQNLIRTHASLHDRMQIILQAKAKA